MHLSGSIDFTILRHRSCTSPSHHQNTDFGAYITDSRRSEVKLRKHGKNRDKTETYGESNGEKGRVSVSYLRRFCSLLPRLSNFLILLLLGVLYQPKNETQQSLRSSEGYFWLLYLEHISESLLSYFYLSKESWIRASTFFFFYQSLFTHASVLLLEWKSVLLPPPQLIHQVQNIRLTCSFHHISILVQSVWEADNEKRS